MRDNRQILDHLSSDEFEKLGETTDIITGLTLSSRACVKLLDVDARLIAMNAPGMALMEIDDFASVCGNPWSALWPPEERATVDAAVYAALAGRTTTFTAYCPTFKGRPRWWDVTVAPIRDAASEIVKILSCSYDVTHLRQQQHELEAELAQSQTVLSSLAEQLDSETRRLVDAQTRARHAEQLKMLGEFVGHVVHDMNNVFAVMQSAARVLRRQLNGTASDAILQEVDKSVNRGSSLVRRLLDFARSEGAVAVAFNPSEIVNGDADLLKHLVGQDATLAIDAPHDIWSILTDKMHFQSVLFNLVSNARDAVGEGGQIKVTVRNLSNSDTGADAPTGDHVVVAISDNGCGMTPEILERAGTAFFTTKGEGKGTGLGLTSAYDLAERSSGTVKIDSTVGLGTRVSLYLPRAPIADNESSPDPFVARKPPAVLIVKRDEAARQRLASFLRTRNLVVLEASSDTAALATLLRGLAIDLVIADKFAGQMDPEHLISAMRRQRPGLSVIYIVSEDDTPPDAADEVIWRPVTATALIAAVRNALAVAAKPKG